MSEAIAFDTYRFVKNLTASGFTEAQAEALADEQVHLLNSNLATKSDIREVKSELELKIEQVKSEAHKAGVGLSIWMMTGWVTQTGLLATLFWYFSTGSPGGGS